LEHDVPLAQDATTLHRYSPRALTKGLTDSWTPAPPKLASTTSTR
jgi:hypothetical protein